jgi:signal transduction histidine kinase
VYILDQLIANAIKYGRKEGRSGDPVLKIWDQGEGETVRLYVEDQGEGIRDSDIRRIFEKGFTGSSCHNGRYRSTGMGLYMADKIAGKLGHRLLVESRYGEYTRFSLVLPRAPALQGM